jgi:HEAT repeat protein/uncharacterized protein YegL
MRYLQAAANGACAASVALMLLLSSPLPMRGQDRDVAAEFKAAKSSLTQQLKDKKKENRLAAVRKLETFPTTEAAKLLLFQGLSSTDEDVRAASFDALAKLNGNEEICAFLKTTVSKQWKQGKPQAETYAGLAILLASELPEVRDEATHLVKDAAARPVQGRNILITLADELGNCRGDSACRSLVQLTQLPLFTQDFAFRRAVEQALTHVRAKQAIGELIKLLATVKGEVRSDIVRYLTDISGEQLGIEPGAWLAWWEKNEAKFEFPPEAKRPLAQNLGLAPPKPPPGPSYYGLPLSGAKIVFILDTSGSMQGPRIIRAKAELSRAIEELPADVEFSIVSFAGRPLTWQPKLVKASTENKQSALYFVAAVQGVGKGTASYDALETAMSFDGEVIYFLTDGAPVGGKITNPPDIVRTITRANQFNRMTINSLGIGVDTPVFDSFLSTLAQQNFGEYQRVDQ